MYVLEKSRLKNKHNQVYIHSYDCGNKPAMPTLYIKSANDKIITQIRLHWKNLPFRLDFLFCHCWRVRYVVDHKINCFTYGDQSNEFIRCFLFFYFNNHCLGL